MGRIIDPQANEISTVPQRSGGRTQIFKKEPEEPEREAERFSCG